MFQATIFLNIQCDNNVRYKLRTIRRESFPEAPKIGFSLAIERHIGNCRVDDVKMSSIPGRQKENTMDVTCLKEGTELTIEQLVDSGRWRLVIGSTVAMDEQGEVDQQRTRKFQELLRRENEYSRTGSHP